MDMLPSIDSGSARLQGPAAMVRALVQRVARCENPTAGSL
jgi:hypothetical protein